MKYRMDLLSKYKKELMGLAALSILFSHAKRFGIVYSSLITRIQGYGMWAVNLFIILSGTGMYFSLKKGAEGFYKRRMIRILPSYYLIAMPAYFILEVLLRNDTPQSFLSYLFFIPYWYVLMTVLFYIVVPLHDWLVKKFGWIVNLIAIIAFMPLGYLVKLYWDEMAGMIVERFSTFILGYWLGPVIEEKKEVPIYITVLMIASIWMKTVLHVSSLHYAVNATFTLAGLAIGMLVSWFLDKIHVSAGTNFLAFLGEFTMEIYMMNVTMYWVMQRLEPLWQGKIDINLIYWIVCVVIAVLIAWAVHVLAGKIIAKLTHAENSKA